MGFAYNNLPAGVGVGIRRGGQRIVHKMRRMKGVKEISIKITRLNKN